MSENTNRAFLYGESVFTTMRMQNSLVLDWDLHYDRLKRGVEFLYGPFSQGPDFDQELRTRLEARWQQESGDKILRLTVYRDQEQRGLIRTGNTSVYDLKISLMSSNWDPLRVNENPLSLRTCAAPERPEWWPSFLKTGNYLHVILAQKMIMKNGDDDLLFLSRQDTITESSVANIFLVRKGKLFTPPAGPQVLEGIMRKKVLDCYQDYFRDCDEDASELEQAYKADAVFATNSVRGLMMIGKIDDRDLHLDPETNEKLKQLAQRIMK